MTQIIDHTPPPAWQAPQTPPPAQTKKKHPVLKTLLILGVLGFLGMGACVAAIGGAANSVKNDNLKTESGVPGAGSTTAKHDGVSLAEFNQIATGMSYTRVAQILGSGGTEMSRTDFGGTSTVMYEWQGSGFASNMNAMFQDGALVSKAQFGLK